MNIRLVDLQKDFNTLNGWHTNSLGLELNREFVFDKTYVVENDNKLLASACLILPDNKAFCIIENVLSDRTVEKQVRREAVSKLFDFLDKEAKRYEYKTIIIASNQSKVIERYKEMNFKEAMSNMTLLVKEIK